jgi:type 1 glutamine amidotransferase
MKYLNSVILSLLLIFSLTACNTGSQLSQNKEKIKALIVDGQNNHDMWPKTSFMMKQYLEETDLFADIDIIRTAYTWKGEEWLAKYPLSNQQTTALKEPKHDPNYQPDFSKYDVVISNFGWNAADWPEGTQKALEKFVSEGGGLVVVHAADNSFPEWKAFNEMIGLGGWGGRTEKDGPYVYYNDSGELVRDDSPGRGGSHGPQHEFQVTLRNDKHPITKGMPEKWLHTQDELYDRLRGPGENMEILATAYSSADNKGTGRHEPMLIVLTYGKGRIFHTPMGHADYSMECVGFIASLTRGTEWAATGKVTQKIPSDFPTADQVSKRDFTLKQ